MNTITSTDQNELRAPDCNLGRRRILRAGVALGGTAWAGGGLLRAAFAQDPPNDCPAPPIARRWAMSEAS